MRTCSTASVVAIIGIPLVTTFAACASGSQPEASGPDKAKTEQKGEVTEVRKDEPKTETPAVTAAATPTAPARKEPHTTADCTQMLTEIVNDPPNEGVVMNNAQTAADAGRSDRFTPMNELIQSKRDAFRCCFDIWAKTHPGQKGKVAFTFELSPDGTLKSASAKKEESDPMAAEVEPCMLEVAKSITFPKSPSGRDTRFTYPFEFKPRR